MMERRIWMVPVLGAALLAFTGIAIAQDSASPNDNAAQANSASTRQKKTAKESSGKTGKESSESNTNRSSQLSAHDRMFMKKAAQGGLEEVELGQMLQQKAESQDVKDFAKRMVDDHSKANDELKSLAEKVGYTLPTTIGPTGKALKARLEKLSGEQLDRAYMRNMVQDHTKDVTEFKSESQTGKDPDLKAWAGQTLPTLQDHLKQAKQLAAKERQEKSSSAKSKKKSAKSTTAQQ